MKPDSDSPRSEDSSSLGSVDRFQLLVDSVKDYAIYLLDTAGHVVSWNDGAERMKGYSSGEIMGQPFSRFYTAEDQASRKPERVLHEALVKGRYEEECLRVRKDGTVFWADVVITPLFDATRGHIGFAKVTRDVSERKLHEEERRERDARLLDHAFDPIFTWELDGPITFWNAGAERLYGFTAGEAVGRALPEVLRTIYPLGRERCVEALRRKGHWEGQLGHTTKDGRSIVADGRMTLVRREGRAPQVLQADRDVTERVRLEEEIAKLARLYEQVIRSVQEGIVVRDERLLYRVWNPFMERTVGLEAAAVIGRHVLDVLPELEGLGVYDAMQRALAGELVRGEDIPFTSRSTGEAVWLSHSHAPLLAADGRIAGVISSVRDVTARKRVEEARSESEARFRQLAESIREVFWLTDLEKHRMLYVSPAYEAIWGQTLESLQVSPNAWLMAVHPDDRDRVAAALSRQVEGSYDEEYRIVRPDGAVRWIRDRAFPVRAEDGRVVRLAGVAEDVTDRRRLEEQLRQTQKLESIGQLAGGVAHDFNNILTVISGYTELILERLPEGDGARRFAEAIHDAGERASYLTRQLLAFSRKQVVERKVVRLDAVVEETESMLRRLLGEDVDLESVRGAGSGRVLADPTHLVQVLMNLAINARDAMPRGGKLSLETSEVELDAAYAKLHPSVAPGRYVRLAVSDTGTGMTPEVVARAFEPFFTTKAPGKGTGLGLSVVHGIVKQSGGHVDVYSEPGLGTTFKVYFPRADAAGDVSPQRSESTELRGSETILLVEDEPNLRSLAAEVLAGRGYVVLQAAEGRDALAAVEEHSGSIDLVVTDVVMPGMDGRELADAIASRYPGMRVLYTSGYTDDAVVRHGVLQEEVDFIQKPYTLVAFLGKIREILDRR